jgi:aspartate carbamoyltransferase catalytic subunit
VQGPRHLLRIDDLADAEVTDILASARDFRRDPSRQTQPGLVVGLLFLSASLRTRIGFATAIARLGGTPVDVLEARSAAEMSAPESFDDTLRTLSGMVDLVVLRTPFALNRDRVQAEAACPVINGGDGAAEHPTQALIDLFAIEELVGRIEDQHVVICGDLTMRATRSLLRLFGRFPPSRLTLVSPPSRAEHEVDLGPRLQQRTGFGGIEDLRAANVLYLPGLPASKGNDHLNSSVRARYAFGAEAARLLPRRSVVLSPLPVVDEVRDDQRHDPRVRMFEQSDLAVAVRASVLTQVRESSSG